MGLNRGSLLRTNTFSKRSDWMRRSIDKLMIGFVMILAVCLYAPTMLEDNKSSKAAEEKVTEVLAEVPASVDPVSEQIIEHNVQVTKVANPTLMPEVEREKALAVQENQEAFVQKVEQCKAEKETTNTTQTAQTYTYENITGDGKLTASKGVNYGPTGKETYYNLNMSGVIDTMQNLGYNAEYWVREDGVKMYGDYVMVAADLNTYPRGTLVESSLGTAIVVDTGSFAASNPNQLDIATSW